MLDYRGLIKLFGWFVKKSRKNAQKIDENVKLYDLIELRPDI